MAGHSKWKNIQHRKGRQDAARGKLFTKLIRLITVAARKGGGDPDANSNLRLAVDKALAANMPRDTIDRAIKRGAGGEDGATLEEISYEGYGPSGVAIIVLCTTDNRNRTVAEVRHAFSKHGGNLGTEGSVAYLFNQKGLLCYPPDSNETAIMEAALNANAEDVISNDDGSIDVITNTEDFANIKQQMLTILGVEPDSAEISFIPTTEVKLDNDAAEKTIRLIEALEDLDDVQTVYTNANFPDEVL